LLGLALVLSASAVYAVAVLIADPASVVLELVIWVPGLLVGGTLWWWRRWGLIVGMLAGAVVVLVLMLPDLEFATPESFFDFVPNLLGMTGGLIVFGASLVGTIQYFRQQASTDASLVKRAFKGVLAMIVALAGASGVLTALSAGGVSDAQAQGAIVLTAEGVKWDTNMIEASSGEPLRILVKNDDPFVHTFTIHDLGIDKLLGPWTETLIEIPSPAARIYGFICRIEDHKQDMSGAIVVR
jgi:hypothetical protein